MKYSGIGGQAVMEGVMMRNGDRYAVAVRKTDGSIQVEKKNYRIMQGGIRNIPIIRGVISFIDSLYLGMSTLMLSASFVEDEEEVSRKEGLSAEEKKKLEEKEKKENDLWLKGTLVLSLLLAAGIFFLLPYGLSCLLHLVTDSVFWITLAEGIIRMVIFIGYIWAISLMPDIKRTYMYHGAEHKCINCIEHGLPLTVENVRSSSKEHKRCGTSFLVIVMIISVFFFMFIRVDSQILKLVLRLLLIPAIAGVSFEFIRLAGKSDSAIVGLLSKPGLWTQKLTTAEPTDDMIEVGIASVNAVFDWEKWQKENL